MRYQFLLLFWLTIMLSMTFDTGTLLLLSGVLGIIYLYRKHVQENNPLSHLPLPPGREGYPLLGNLLELPTQFEWKTYHEWSKELDTDILRVNVAGTTVIVLDSSEAATELLERRSSRYSGRPRMPMVNELMGWDYNFVFQDYGPSWRRRRRLMHYNFHPTAALRFRPKLVKAARNTLARFLVYPEAVVSNAKYMAGDVIMSIVYGINVLPKDDPYIAAAEKSIHPLVVAAVPGAFLVDAIPILKYVPDWMPGAGFKKKAREWRKLVRFMLEDPFKTTKKMMAEGDYPTSVVSDSLTKMPDVVERDDAYLEDNIQDVAGTMYAGGSDTTSSAIASCILGLLEKPDVLKKAQQQLDSVLKPGDLPDFDDDLPYITAIVMETLRWRDVVPISVPHLLIEEDEYKGNRLPKGSVIIPNAWAMLHDEEIYPDPFEFKPERFLNADGTINKSVRDPAHACWGFGRRICPGRYMAFSQIWIAVASLLTVYDIKKAVDKDGRVIELSHEYTSGLVCTPKPFRCSITPRSKEAEALIRSAATQEVD
ncbi:cytochrome P450 [Agrocybe pediades]|nr:cytochrome P450 [Agrocybe pediades]